MVTVATDLFADVAARCRLQLDRGGYFAGEDAVIDYVRVLHRLIMPRPRTVHVAKELVCPQDCQGAFEAICRKARAGDDLRPHLHRDRGRSDFNDGMLNDWGIHHLHLSTTLEADGYVERSAPVLFARVADEDFYCIAVLDHGRGHDPWTNEEVLEIVHRNWPQSIEHMTQKFPAGQPGAGERKVPTKVLKTLRKKHANIFTQRDDGTVHMPVGGGVVASGTNVLVMKERDRIELWCRWFDNELRHQVEQWSARGNCASDAELSFQWEVGDGRVVAVERSGTVRFDFTPLGQRPDIAASGLFS